MGETLRHSAQARREGRPRRGAAEAREVARLHRLRDRWLANEILRLARLVRADVPPGRDDGPVASLLWDVMPEVARRLGAPIMASESIDVGLRDCGPGRLREVAGECLWRVGRRHLAESERPDDAVCPVSLLTRECGDGNPLAIALDRVAPPSARDDDCIARRVRGAAACRGRPAVSAWHPGLSAPSGIEDPEEFEALTIAAP